MSIPILDALKAYRRDAAAADQWEPATHHRDKMHPRHRRVLEGEPDAED